jgi:hypothetical protein
VSELERINDFTNFRGIRARLTDFDRPLRGFRTQSLLTWWQSNGAPPQRSQFDILDHAANAASLFLVRRLEPGRFQYRLSGQEVIRIVGRNSRGEYFSTADPSSRAAFAQHLENVAQDRTPWVCEGTTEIAGRVGLISFESVDCPLFGDDGEIGWIIGGMEALKHPQP